MFSYIRNTYRFVVKSYRKVYYFFFPREKDRSPLWPKVRKEHLKKFPTCAACGSRNSSSIILSVHHKKPFNLYPKLELDPDNLITLCMPRVLGGRNCHYTFGHLYSWSSYNSKVVEDAKAFLSKLQSRP